VYDYIARMYGIQFQPGMRVQHTINKDLGEVRRPGNTPGHYVSVRFDNGKHNLPCHPQELVIFRHVVVEPVKTFEFPDCSVRDFRSGQPEIVEEDEGQILVDKGLATISSVVPADAPTVNLEAVDLHEENGEMWITCRDLESNRVPRKGAIKALAAWLTRTLYISRKHAQDAVFQAYA